MFDHVDNKPFSNIVEIVALFHIPQCQFFFRTYCQMAPVARIESDPSGHNMRQVLRDKLLAIREFPVKTSLCSINKSQHIYKKYKLQ